MTGPGRCLVVGGRGAVGRMVAGWLRSAGGDVVAVDLGDGPDVLTGDVTAPDGRLLAELAVADVVVLAVPEPVAIAALPGVVSTLREGSLLVDTLSVKTRYVAAARRAGAGTAGLEVLGLNPMFAPALGLPGRPVAVVTVVDGVRARRMRELLVACGGRTVPVTPAEHDRLAGATQALTHAAVLAFGLALDRLDVGIEELTAFAPPPHVAMLGLLARIVSGVPDVYWDVQAANPQAAVARTALAECATELTGLFEGGGSEAAFTGLLDRLREFFGPQLHHHGDRCAQSFAALASA